MSRASAVFNQNDGEITKAYYAHMNAKGLVGQLAVALFRAQKRSTAAKKYRRGKYRHSAYDVKNWSLQEICRILTLLNSSGYAFEWGWRRDENTPGFEWVLYCSLPGGQASFHSAERLSGPDFKGEWIQHPGSEYSIIHFCDGVDK